MKQLQQLILLSSYNDLLFEEQIRYGACQPNAATTCKEPWQRANKQYVHAFTYAYRMASSNVIQLYKYARNARMQCLHLMSCNAPA